MHSVAPRQALCLATLILLLADPSRADTYDNTLDLLTGLAVDQNGMLEMTSVVNLEYWKPLISIGGLVFKPGTPVAMTKQTDNVFTALAVDSGGRLVVSWVEGAGIWHPPVAISDAIFQPASPVAMAKQTNDVLTAMAIDKDGHMVVAWVTGLGAWNAPFAVSGAYFVPGSYVSLTKQTNDVLTAAAVDKDGRLGVAWVTGLGEWNAPFAISDAIFVPGSAVTMIKQTDHVLTAIAVDKDGHLVVAWVTDLGAWNAPFAISGPYFIPGSPVAMAKQTNDVLTVAAVDKDGRLGVAWVTGLGEWNAPYAISDAIFMPGTPVTMAKQTKGVLTALAIDKDGRIVVVSVAELGIWKEPVAITPPRFPPGAPVTLAKQVEGIDLCVFLSRQPAESGSAITQRISQLTGGYDVEDEVFGLFNVNHTESHGVKGVDLGANTEFQDKLVFFFGDVGDAPGDWVAYTTDTVPQDNGFTLTSVDKSPFKSFDQFYPFTVKGLGLLGIGETPTGAFAYPGAGSDGQNQAFVFAFYHPNPEHPDLAPYPPGSILTKSPDPTQPIDYDLLFSLSPLFNEAIGRVDENGTPVYEGDSNKFFQVAPWVIQNSAFPGVFPSDDGDGLVMMGGGAPASSLHLAWMPLFKGQDPDPSKIQYYCGDGCWSPTQKDSATLFYAIGYTSFNLSYILKAKRWVLLYSLGNGGRLRRPDEPPYFPGGPIQHNPNGPVVARVGKTPFDWSDEYTIFDPLRDNALGKFMHRSGCDDMGTTHFVVGFNPDLYGDDGIPGNAYGPFLINRFNQFDDATRVLTMYYIMSTYTPYQVHLMRTNIGIPADPLDVDNGDVEVPPGDIPPDPPDADNGEVEAPPGDELNDAIPQVQYLCGTGSAGCCAGVAALLPLSLVGTRWRQRRRMP